MATSTKKVVVNTQPSAVTTTLKPQTSTAGVLVLQWLTYAFWGWLIVGLIWLISVILTNAIIGSSVSEVVPYAIAASVVMLPLAFVTDLFYRKHEPLRKAGAATVIMVIHAVIFALLGIGALIISVFTALNAAINAASENDTTTVVILVAVFATIVYAAAFIRTLNPFKKSTGSSIYAFAMLGVTALLLIAAIAGPVVASVATRGDRQIEQHLPTVNYAIHDYVNENNELPENLNQLEFNSQDTEAFVKDTNIKYTPEGVVSGNDKNEVIGTNHRYQLCVEYAKESEGSRYDYGYESSSSYKNNLSTYRHDAGEVCYKLQTRSNLEAY